MRKYQQQLLLETLRTFEEAQSIGEYSDCLKAAVMTINIIDKTEGEGTKTTQLLEEYCELLEKALKDEVSHKALRKHLIKVENSVKSELKPNKIEVVFFPYCPSMWDSLESIYLAAKDDPQCDVFVVPIPYYELNPDETFGQLRYEGDKFPEDLPITHWKEYKVEEYHPDIIFTHYAYDDNSSNLNIHPDFYSRKLKNHCELLIHVPYFIEIGQSVTEYYGYLPGVLFADYVVLQSEYVRQEYIKQYNTCIRENKLEGMFEKAKDKFIALGSPKIDKVINSKKEDFELPQDWRRFVGKSDKPKKIILYNTHMWEMIGKGEKYFNKVRSVFEMFEKSDDAVLWWRPHPNMEVNIKTKCPEMLRLYLDLVNDYLLSGIGIYDDTPDLHRAIAWSDAYYGDWSSLVRLYQVTGKPVMIQNIEYLEQDEKRPFFTNICDDGDSLWFTEYNINALFKMSKKTMKPEFVSELPHGDGAFSSKCTPLYHRAAIIGNKIYFPPMYAKDICVYSIDNKSFKTISVNNANDFDVERAFVRAVEHKNYIYFTPCMYPAILRLNTLTDEIDYFTDWVSPLKKIMADKEKPYFTHPITVDNLLILVSHSGNAVMELNMDTQEHVIHRVGNEKYSYHGICFDGSYYWLSPRNNAPVIKWNKETGEVKEYEIPGDAEGSASPSFRPVIYCNDYVWLLPGIAHNAVKINIYTDVVSEAKEFKPYFQNNQSTYYNCAFTFADSIYAYNVKNRHMIEYNCKLNECKTTTISYSPEVMTKLQPLVEKQIFNNSEALQTEDDCYCYENNITGLSDLIEHMSNTQNDSKKVATEGKRVEIVLHDYANTDGTAGKDICNHFRKKILGL